MKRLEATLNGAIEVKEDAEARLTSSESVKDFMVGPQPNISSSPPLDI